MFVYHGSFLFEKIDNGILHQRGSQQAKEWNHAGSIMRSLPVHVHLLGLFKEGATTLFGYRQHYLNALEGNLATLSGFSTTRYIDFLYQLSFALETLHGIGIIHQNVTPANIWVCRSNQYCSGYLVVLGGFSRSGRGFFGQSPLNPRRPTVQLDVAAFYQLGITWKIPDWPQLETLPAYQAWMWMQPCAEKPGVPFFLTLHILELFGPRYPAAARIAYVIRCNSVGRRILKSTPPQIYPSDAELLDIIAKLDLLILRLDVKWHKNIYRVILDLLDLVAWETPEADTIAALRNTFLERVGGGNATANSCSQAACV